MLVGAEPVGSHSNGDRHDSSTATNGVRTRRYGPRTMDRGPLRLLRSLPSPGQLYSFGQSACMVKSSDSGGEFVCPAWRVHPGCRESALHPLSRVMSISSSFQFAATQRLEGYRGPSSIARAAMFSRAQLHLERAVGKLDTARFHERGDVDGGDLLGEPEVLG